MSNNNNNNNNNNNQENREFSTQDAAFVFLAFLSFFLIPATYHYGQALYTLLTKKPLVQKCHCLPCDLHHTEERKRKSKELQKPFFSLYFILYLFFLIAYLYVLSRVWQNPFSGNSSSSSSSEPFDPYAILNLSPGASKEEAIKAYRKMSVLYHPDRFSTATEDVKKEMEEKFIQLAKAKAALTDDATIENLEKYGNPDGPQGTKIGIALPEFLMQKENASYIMLVYAVLLLIILPTVVFLWWRKATSMANEVMLNSLRVYMFLCQESTALPRKHIVEILCTAEEFLKLIPLRSTDEQPINRLLKLYDVHLRPIMSKIFDPSRQSIVTKVLVLYSAHLNGSRDDLKAYPDLDKDLDIVLDTMPKLLEAFPDVAFQLMSIPSKNFQVKSGTNPKKQRQLLDEDMLKQKEKGMAVLDELLSIMQCTYQGLREDEDPIMQLPHVTDQVIKEIRKKSGKKSWVFNKHGNNLPSALHTSVAERRQLLEEVLTTDQMSDIDGALQIIPNVEVDFSHCVADEVVITPASVISFYLLIHDPNVKKISEIQPAHTPRFATFRQPYWWVMLYQTIPKSSPRIIQYKKKYNIYSSYETDDFCGPELSNTLWVKGIRGIKALPTASTSLIPAKIRPSIVTALKNLHENTEVEYTLDAALAEFKKIALEDIKTLSTPSENKSHNHKHSHGGNNNNNNDNNSSNILTPAEVKTLSEFVQKATVDVIEAYFHNFALERKLELFAAKYDSEVKARVIASDSKIRATSSATPTQFDSAVLTFRNPKFAKRAYLALNDTEFENSGERLSFIFCMVMQFQSPPEKGNYQYYLSIKCDTYLGIDVRQDFKVSVEDEIAKKEVQYLEEEDEEPEEEEDEEEDEDDEDSDGDDDDESKNKKKSNGNNVAEKKKTTATKPKQQEKKGEKTDNEDEDEDEDEDNNNNNNNNNNNGDDDNEDDQETEEN